MASVSLTTTRDRANFFQETILTNLRYWQEWLSTKKSDVAALGRERNNVVRAILFAFELQDTWSETQMLIETFSPWMERSGYWDVWNRVLSQAISMARQMEDVPGEAHLSALLGRLLRRQSCIAEAVTYHWRAIRLSRQIDDTFGEARACTNLGYIYIEYGHWYRAEVLCCHALALFEQIDSNHGRAHTENHLGVLYTRRGIWDKARQHLERAYGIWQSMDDAHGEMHACNNIGLLLIEMRYLDQAQVYLNKALDQANQMGEESLIGTIHMNFGNGYRLNNEPAKATEYYWQAKTIFKQFANTHGLALVEGNLGLACMFQENWEEANLHLQTAMDIWCTLDNKPGKIQAMLDLLEYELTIGNKHQAKEWLDKATRLLYQYDQTGRYHHLHKQVDKFRRSLTPV